MLDSKRFPPAGSTVCRGHFVAQVEDLAYRGGLNQKLMLVSKLQASYHLYLHWFI